MAGNNILNSVKMSRPQTSVFNLNHDHKLSCRMGELVPVMVIDTLPGDRFSISQEALMRMAPMITPVMHHYDVYFHTFFVPNRLVWPHWDDYISNNKIGSPTPALPAHPYVPILNDGSNYTRLCDFMGLPNPADNPTANTTTTISPLAFAAYQTIWNEYYRDQNLIPKGDFQLPDGSVFTDWANYSTMRRRAWEHDYFTSALPFAQKGDAIDVPLGDVVLKPDWAAEVTGNPTFQTPIPAIPNPGTIDQITSAPAGSAFPGFPALSLAGSPSLAYNPYGSLEVAPTSINDLRLAFKLQEWLEKNARGGTRYTEVIRAHFGVISPDARLQRPEYICGSKSPMVISEVLNTTGTTDAPQGNMAGHGVSVAGGERDSYYCYEHGYIITIMSVMPRTAYFQGVPRHFLKFDSPTQLYWPSFANIGEQEILGQEIYAYDNSTLDTSFGYLPRYAEYRLQPNRVSGDFRNTLDFWHHARKFASPPALNQTFIECNPDDRVFAVEDPDVDNLYCHVYNKVRAVRPIPKYGTPTF